MGFQVLSKFGAPFHPAIDLRQFLWQNHDEKKMNTPLTLHGFIVIFRIKIGHQFGTHPPQHVESSKEPLPALCTATVAASGRQLSGGQRGYTLNHRF